MRQSRVRTMGGLLLATGLCLGSASPAITQLPEAQAARPRPVFRHADAVEKIGLDVLEDGIEIPDAWDQTEVSMANDQTELPFQVYAIGQSNSTYWNLSEFPRQVDARIIGAGGRDPLRARVKLVKQGEEAHWVLQVLRRPRRGRLVTLQVTFRAGVPRTTWRTDLHATIPGRLPARE